MPSAIRLSHDSAHHLPCGKDVRRAGAIHFNADDIGGIEEMCPGIPLVLCAGERAHATQQHLTDGGGIHLVRVPCRWIFPNVRAQLCRGTVRAFRVSERVQSGSQCGIGDVGGGGSASARHSGELKKIATMHRDKIAQLAEVARTGTSMPRGIIPLWRSSSIGIVTVIGRSIFRSRDLASVSLFFSLDRRFRNSSISGVGSGSREQSCPCTNPALSG